MICQPECAVPADCCPSPKNIPPGISCPEDFPFNFVCPDGVCRPGGCQSDTDCAYFPGPMRICVDPFGLGWCRVPCESESDCENAGPGPFPLACDGVTDRGVMYCGAIQPPDCRPPEPGERCMKGVCTCADDDDCIRGWGCTPAW